MNLRASIRRLAVLVLVAVMLSASVAPAFAFDGPVPGNAIVGGHYFIGLSEAEARSDVAALPVPALAPVQVLANGRSFVFDPTPAVHVDVEAMLAAIYSVTTTEAPGVDIPVSYTVDRAAIDAWVAGVAAEVDKAAVNAKYSAGARRLYLSGAASGLKLDQAGASAALYSAVLAEVAAGGAAQPPVTFTVNVVNPTITGANHGRVILVILKERRLLLYNNGKVERTYRTAVGMRRYPTPTGVFRVIRKVKGPAWYNPGSAWARGMPRYIKPGPNNPLGTHALYLNAPGIRIHGTSNIRSLGTAASHGCVRVANRDIAKLYTLVPVGTKVFIVK